MHRISANSFRGNYSFLEVRVRQVFKGGNYCVFFFTFCTYICIIKMQRKKRKIKRYCFFSSKFRQIDFRLLQPQFYEKLGMQLENGAQEILKFEFL